MRNQLDQQLHDLKHMKARTAPRASWVSENKQRLFSQISGQEKQPQRSLSGVFEQTARIFVPQQFTMLARSVAVIALAFVVTISGWSATVSASANSVPGEALYTVKRAAEQGQLLVTRDKKEQAKLKTEFAGRRSEEITRVVKEKKNVPAEVIAETTKEIEELLQTANADIQAVKEEDLESAAELAKELSKKTDDIVIQLTEVVSEQPEEEHIKEGTKDVTDTKKVVADVGVEAIDLVRKAKLEGANVSDDEFAEIIASRLVVAEQSVERATQQVEEVKKAVEGVDEGLETIATMPSTSTITSTPETVDTTPEEDNNEEKADEIDDTGVIETKNDIAVTETSSTTLSSTIMTVEETEALVKEASEEVKEKVNQIERHVNDVDEVVSEVEALLNDQSDTGLADVVNKIKEITSLEQEVTETLVEAKEQVDVIVETTDAILPKPVEPVIEPEVGETVVSSTIEVQEIELEEPAAEEAQLEQTTKIEEETENKNE